MSFYQNLFRYRQRLTRSPFEDFLTECFAYLLNRADDAGLSGQFLSCLFNVDGVSRASLSWTTQHTIPLESRHAPGRRPDLVARGTIDAESAFILVENKVSAGYTGSGDGEDGQLNAYMQYLSTRPEHHRYGRLLTLNTAPPPGWNQSETCYWRDIYRRLSELRAGFRTACPVLSQVTIDFLDFLEENDMDEIRLGITEVASGPAWNRARAACHKLGGGIWSRVQGYEALNVLSSGGFAVTHGNRYGEFRSSADRFSGVLWTPCDGGTDRHAEYSNAICWIGVMWSKIYEIQPEIVDVPEFSAGFVVWPFNDNFGDEDRERIQDITARLNDGDADSGPWKCWFLPEAVYSSPPYQRVTIRRAQSFWDLVKEKPDWLDVRDSFVSEVMAAFERLSPEDVSYLRGWADQTRPDGPSEEKAS